MTANNFYNVTAPWLKAFVKVRMTEDVSTLTETNDPKKKGEACGIVTTEETLLLEMEHKCNNKEFIARKSNSLIFSSNNLAPITMQNSENFNISLDFILTPECVKKCYECVSNLECLSQQRKQSKIGIIDALSNSKLKKHNTC